MKKFTDALRLRKIVARNVSRILLRRSILLRSQGLRAYEIIEHSRIPIRHYTNIHIFEW